MAIKSLTITEDAYETLKRLKYQEESFSEVILRMGKGNTETVEKYFGILKESKIDAKAWKENIRKEREKVDKEYVEKQRKIWSSRK